MWQRCSERKGRHRKSNLRQSALAFGLVQNRLNPNDRVNAPLNEKLRSTQENNRECVNMGFQTVKFLSGKGLVRRVKTDDEINFREALNMIVESHDK